MKAGRINVGLLFAMLAIAGGLTAFDIPYLWLESPSGRDNAHDPRSPLFIPTSKPTLAPVPPTCTGTPSPSSTDSPTWVDSPTSSTTPSVTESSTPSATDLPSNTETNTPTPTSTPTVPSLWYDGDSPGASFSAAGASYSNNANTTIAEQVGVGSNGSTYLHVHGDMMGAGYTAASIQRSDAPWDVSTLFNQLEISFRVPSATGNDFRPSITLISSLGATAVSVPVTAAAYTLGDSILAADSWVKCIIPLTAFLGPNLDVISPYTFTSADLGSLLAVRIQAMSGMSVGGNFVGEIEVDEIMFTYSATPPVQRDFNTLISDFGTQDGKTYFNRNWIAAGDSYTCVTPYTTVLSPYPPLGAPGSMSSPARAGHFVGFGGGASGLGSGTCTWEWVWMNMGVSFPLSGTVCNLANNGVFKTLPAGGATGLKFKLKLGSPAVGQTYAVIIVVANVLDFAHFGIQIADTSLNTSTFTDFEIDFPADGYTCSPATAHNWPYAATELFWAQPDWAGFVPFQRSLFQVVTIAAGRANTAFDVYIDDVQFY